MYINCMSRTVKCRRCHTWRLPTDFISKDRNMKCCSRCREVANAQQRKWCEDHADQINERGARRRKYYVDQKISNPLHMKFNQMIHHSVYADTISNRLYDLQDYIDEDFLNYLWNEQSQYCYHCKCEMTLDFTTTTRVPTQISIQRLNNDLPHIKKNCVLACLSCNFKRKELTKVE